MATPPPPPKPIADPDTQYWLGYLRSTAAAVKQIEEELQRAEQKLFETQSKCNAGIQQLTALKEQLVVKRNQAVEKQAARITAYEKLLESMGRNKSTNALYQQLSRPQTLSNKARLAASTAAAGAKAQQPASQTLSVASSASSAPAQKLAALKRQNKATALAKPALGGSGVQSLLARKA